MFTKLIKYEWLATSRILLPLYIVTAFMTAFTKFIYSLDIFNDSLSIVLNIIMFLYMVSLIITFAATFILIIQRFYKNLLTGEGYLMFTLPTKVSTLINSKLVVSVAWTIISVIVCFISLLVVIPAASKFNPALEGFSIKEILHLMSKENPWFYYSFILVIFFALILNILTFYTSIAIGQMISTNKVLGSVIAYVGIYTSYQVVGLIVVGISTLLPIDFTDMKSASGYIIAAGLTLSILGSIVFYCITLKVLTKRLNLE